MLVHAAQAQSSCPHVFEQKAQTEIQAQQARIGSCDQPPEAGTDDTVRHRGMGTGISEASKRVPIFSFATQGGKQVSSHFRQGN